MKFKKIMTATWLTASLLTVAACGTEEEAGSEEMVTEITEETNITFWHAMNSVAEETLVEMTDQFMEENPNITVELQNQSSYQDLQAKINATLPSPDDLPTITQAYPGWLYSASEEGLVENLTPYIENETIGWGDQEQIKDTLLEGAVINDVQYGIPFNKSTEILFYNVDLLEQYDVGVPTTFEELKEASQQIYERSNQEVVGAGFDSLHNYYVIGMKGQGIELNADLDLTSEASVEVIDYYREGIKAGYFRTAGSDGYLSVPFASENIAMFVGSIAGAGYVDKDAEANGFNYDVTKRPGNFNIQQGTDVYMFSGAESAEKTAGFLFMKYLASEDAQLKWSVNTGYMPILDSVLESDAYKNSEGTMVPQKLEDAVTELFSIPVIENADPAYNEIRTIIETIFATSDRDTLTMLEEAQPQLEQIWNQ